MSGYDVVIVGAGHGGPQAAVALRQPGFWAERQVTVLTGRRVASVDPEGRTIITDEGAAIGYGALVWAAGGHARPLSCSGHDLAGVHSVRTRADADRMRA